MSAQMLLRRAASTEAALLQQRRRRAATCRPAAVPRPVAAAELDVNQLYTSGIIHGRVWNPSLEVAVLPGDPNLAAILTESSSQS